VPIPTRTNRSIPVVGFHFCSFLQVINNEFSAVERQRIYLEGGVISVTCRILVVDLLNRLIPKDLISGLIINAAHRIKDGSTEQFICRLYRDQSPIASSVQHALLHQELASSSSSAAAAAASSSSSSSVVAADGAGSSATTTQSPPSLLSPVNRPGFIIALSDSPENLTRGFMRVEKVMTCLHVRKLHLWPRYVSMRMMNRWMRSTEKLSIAPRLISLVWCGSRVCVCLSLGSTCTCSGAWTRVHPR
jgi:hypothetical protein